MSTGGHYLLKPKASSRKRSGSPYPLYSYIYTDFPRVTETQHGKKALLSRQVVNFLN